MDTKQNWAEKKFKTGPALLHSKRRTVLERNAEAGSTFFSFPTDKNTLENYFLRVSVVAFFLTLRPHLYCLTIAGCSSLKLFNPTLTVDSVPQGPHFPSHTPAWTTATVLALAQKSFLQSYFSTLVNAAVMIPFFLQTEKWKYRSTLELWVSPRRENWKRL